MIIKMLPDWEHFLQGVKDLYFDPSHQQGVKDNTKGRKRHCSGGDNWTK